MWATGGHTPSGNWGRGKRVGARSRRGGLTPGQYPKKSRGYAWNCRLWNWVLKGTHYKKKMFVTIYSGGYYWDLLGWSFCDTYKHWIIMLDGWNHTYNAACWFFFFFFFTKKNWKEIWRWLNPGLLFYKRKIRSRSQWLVTSRPRTEASVPHFCIPPSGKWQQIYGFAKITNQVRMEPCGTTRLWRTQPLWWLEGYRPRS